MGKIVTVATTLAFAALAFAGKCDYDGWILEFQKRMDKVQVMDGAEKAVLNESKDGTAVIRLRSKPLQSGKFKGLTRSEAYFFGGCKPWQVIVSHSNRETKAVAQQATVFLRADGNLRAICNGNSDVKVKNPIDGTISPNEECTCYDENSMERPFGKFGCLYEDEIDEMIKHNNNSGGGILGDIMRNGTKVK